MSLMAIFRLCKTLKGQGLRASTVNMSFKEQLLMFLHIVSHNMSIEKGKMIEVNEERKTQFQWPKSMSKELLNFLASKKKFNGKYLSDHIDIHLNIMKMHELSYLRLEVKNHILGGMTTLNIMTVSHSAYETYTTACNAYQNSIESVERRLFMHKLVILTFKKKNNSKPSTLR
ncbi:hypothetical protein Cgig2_029968 [Carnegiea gigantea]|uniref:Uncharacterized protein n=1 Tax=Carnegiea gigantea TaxID=171969 RepID=A0A9Q1GIX5_9CARY|nr:hypothetical protein Cgig2_029968 [Carnegiea gigantea]